MHRYNQVPFAIMLIALLFKSTKCQETIQLETAMGPVKGLLEDVSDSKLKTFLGIPYALPPTGSRRFSNPIVLEKWPGSNADDDDVVDGSGEVQADNNSTQNEAPSPWDGTAYRDSCTGSPPGKGGDAASPVTFSEDCLYLNIFAPQTPKAAENTTFPVLFVLPSGGDSGRRAADGRQLAADGAVVVTADARTGLFGFLPVGGDNSNLGLKDHLAALQWVKANVRDYGGDADDVTVVGTGAGATALLYHLLSESSAELIHKAIVMSDERSLFVPPKPESEAKRTTSEFLEKVGCSSDLMGDELVNCLANHNSTVLVETEVTSEWSPFIDGDTITEDMPKKWADGKLIAIPIIFGFSSSMLSLVPENVTVRREDVKRELERVLAADYGRGAAGTVAVTTLREYAPQDQQLALYNLVNQVTDAQNSKSLNAIFKKYARANPNATFVFTPAEGMVTQTDLFRSVTETVSKVKREAPSDNMRNTMHNIIVDFTTSGNPGSSLPSPANPWPPVTEENVPTLELSSLPRINPDLQPRRKEYWESYVPEVVASVNAAVEEACNNEGPHAAPITNAYFIATWVLLALLIFFVILMLVLLYLVYKMKRDSYNMDREGTVKYVAK